MTCVLENGEVSSCSGVWYYHKLRTGKNPDTFTSPFNSHFLNC